MNRYQTIVADNMNPLETYHALVTALQEADNVDDPENAEIAQTKYLAIDAHLRDILGKL